MARQKNPALLSPPVSAPIPATAPQTPRPSTATHSTSAVICNPDMAPPESGPKPRLSIGTCSRLTGWHSHGTVMERRRGFPGNPFNKGLHGGETILRFYRERLHDRLFHLRRQGNAQLRGLFQRIVMDPHDGIRRQLPVTQRYRVAPMAYTSVHGPWFPLLEYCSSGA